MTQSNTLKTDRRRQTRNSLFRYIYDADAPVSRQQLAMGMSLSLPTVHQNLSELLAADVIKPGEVQKSTGGRPAVGYTVNETARFSAGVAVTATSIRFMLVDLKLNEIYYKTTACDSLSGGQIGEQIAAGLEEALSESGIGKDRLLGAGITVPGVIDQERDTIVLSPTLRMKDISLSEVKKPIPCPVFIENDSTCGGTAEWLGLPLDERDENFVYLSFENGIGGAVFIGGKPYPGSNGRSGEFGHMSVIPDGRLCNCGRRGCLEAYCSALRFTRDLGISADEFFSGLKEGNSRYTELWNEILGYLSIAINNLRMAFDCRVILGGYISSYLEPYLQTLREMTYARDTFGREQDYLVLGRHPMKAGMLGAAWHFTELFIEGI